MSRLPAFIACAAVLLGACSSHSADEAAAQKQAAAPKQKTVFDDQLKALEKAKAVQKTVDDAAKAQEKAIDDAGG